MSLILLRKHLNIEGGVVRTRVPVDPTCVLYLPLYKLGGSSFVSKDAYGHYCTVIGALWTPQGRDCDGGDDIVTVTDASPIQNVFDAGGTIRAWLKPRSDGGADSGRIVTKTDKWTLWVTLEASGKVKLNFFLAFSTTSGNWATTSTEVALNVWSHVAVVYDSSNVANDPIIYVNGVSVALTEAATPVGTRTSDAGFNLLLANRAAQDRGFDGIIGSYCLDKRPYSVSMVQRDMLAEKWRYG